MEKISHDKYYKNAVLEHTVYQLLKGGWADCSAFEISEMGGLETYSDYFFTAVLGIDKVGNRTGIVALLRDVFSKVFEVNYKSYLIGLTDYRCVLMVNLKENADLCEIKKLLEKGQQYLAEKFQITMFIGVGAIKQGLENVYISYQEALKALEYKYLYGTNQVLLYEQIRERQPDYPVATESKLYLQFMSFIMGHEDDTCSEQFVNFMFQQYGIMQNVSVETARFFSATLMGTVNSICSSRNYILLDVEKEMEVLKNAVSINEFKASLSRLLDILCVKESKHASSENVFCIKAKKYIKQNYPNNDLSLGLTANELGISEKYLAKCFKDGCNIKIQDYIAQIRILNAKRQLENTEDSILEIATACGFLSSGVFIKTFKKLEGITPGVYRKIMTKREMED